MNNSLKSVCLVSLTVFALLVVLGAAGVFANNNNDNGNETEVEDVNEIDFPEVQSNVGKFGLIGTITAVNATDKTIAVNGVTVDVSEARIVGWRWRKLAESTGRPWKDWWKEWTEDELKVGDKVRVGGKIQDGKLIAKLVVLHAFRIVEELKRCEVDADCSYLVLPKLQDRFEAQCDDGRCRLHIKGEQATGTEEETQVSGEGGGAISHEGFGPARVQDRLQEIQSKINEILKKIQELQSRLGAAAGRSL